MGSRVDGSRVERVAGDHHDAGRVSGGSRSGRRDDRRRDHDDLRALPMI